MRRRDFLKIAFGTVLGILGLRPASVSTAPIFISPSRLIVPEDQLGAATAILDADSAEWQRANLRAIASSLDVP